MEFSSIFEPSLFREKVYPFLSGIQKRSAQAKSNPETLKIARGLVLLFISVILAWTSIQVTREESFNLYENQHWPNRVAWKQLLLNRGLIQKTSIGSYSKLLESNPAAFLGESKIWVTADACVVFIPKSAYDSGPELWTCSPDPKGEGWKNLGSGLRGFERLIDLFEKLPRKPLISLKKTVKSIDPKEFHY